MAKISNELTGILELWRAIQKEARANLSTIKKIGTETKQGLGKLDLGKSEDIAKLNKQIEKLEKQIIALKKAKTDERTVTTELDRLKKQEIALNDKLKASTSDLAKSNAVLTQKLNEQRKANREAAKAASPLITLYQKQSAKLRDLRAEYKDLVLSEKGASKEAIKLRREITRLRASCNERPLSINLANEVFINLPALAAFTPLSCKTPIMAPV